MSIFFVKSILFFCIKAKINHLHRSRLANGRTWPKILGEWAWQGTKLQAYFLQRRGHILRYFYGNLFFLTADLFLCINSVHKNSCVRVGVLTFHLSKICPHFVIMSWIKNCNKLLTIFVQIKTQQNHHSHWRTLIIY